VRSTTRIVLVLVALSVVAEAQVTEPVVVRNPEVSAPVVPTVFNGDLRDLPVVRGPRPGDPAIDCSRSPTRRSAVWRHCWRRSGCSD
jgi:hypothetical protein